MATPPPPPPPLSGLSPFSSKIFWLGEGGVGSNYVCIVCFCQITWACWVNLHCEVNWTLRNSLLGTQLNHFGTLVKWLTVCLWTKWLCVRIPLQSFKHLECFSVKARFYNCECCNDAILLRYWTLRKKCPSTEFFLVRIFLYLDWIRENTDQEKLRIRTFFARCAFLIIPSVMPPEYQVDGTRNL